jgi:hypothetical protein
MEIIYQHPTNGPFSFTFSGPVVAAYGRNVPGIHQYLKPTFLRCPISQLFHIALLLFWPC